MSPFLTHVIIFTLAILFPGTPTEVIFRHKRYSRVETRARAHSRNMSTRPGTISPIIPAHERDSNSGQQTTKSLYAITIVNTRIHGHVKMVPCTLYNLRTATDQFADRGATFFPEIRGTFQRDADAYPSLTAYELGHIYYTGGTNRNAYKYREQGRTRGEKREEEEEEEERRG